MARVDLGNVVIGMAPIDIQEGMDIRDDLFDGVEIGFMAFV
jgi:hypothetical protein